MINSFRKHLPHALFMAPSIAFISLAAIYYRKFRVDDVYIYFVYVKNLLRGNGLTFNGTYVEGFSSVLWVSLLSFFGLFTKDLLLLAKLLSFAFALCNTVLIYIIVQRACGNRFFSMLGSLFFATSPFVCIWTAGALETQLFSFMFLLSIHFLALSAEADRLKVLTGLMFGLLAASRPEGFVIFGIVPLFYLYERFGPQKAGYRQSAIYAGYFGVIALLLIWRYSLYSDILPNTAYAKSGNVLQKITGDGLTYAGNFLRYHFPIVTAAALLINLFHALRSGGNPYSKRLSFLSVISIAAYTAFIISAGGDWMPWLRLFVPVTLFLACTYALAAHFVFSLIKNRYLRTIPALIPVICIIMFVYYPLRTFNLQNTIYGTQKGIAPEIIQFINNNATKDDYIAVVDAGEIPYRTEARVIDMIGLNDRHIASQSGGFMEKYDTEYVLSHKPVIVQMHIKKTGSGALQPINFIGSSDLFYSSEFQSNYKFAGKGLFRRLHIPRENHIMTDFYNAEFSLPDSRAANNQIMVDLANNGTGTWVAGDAFGCMFVHYAVFNYKDGVFSEKVVTLPGDIRPGESGSLSLRLPALNRGNYLISISLFHHISRNNIPRTKETILSFEVQ